MTAEPLERGRLVPAPDSPECCIHQTPRLRLLPSPVSSRSRAGSASNGGAELCANALHRRALHYVQAVVEIVEGDRSATQLLPWAEPKVYNDVVARTGLRHRGQHRAGRRERSSAHVVSVRVYQPRQGIAEVAAHVRLAQRSYALAGRFEIVDGRWICTVLDWGAPTD